jgi:hypothetical protein
MAYVFLPTLTLAQIFQIGTFTAAARFSQDW